MQKMQEIKKIWACFLILVLCLLSSCSLDTDIDSARNRYENQINKFIEKLNPSEDNKSKFDKMVKMAHQFNKKFPEEESTPLFLFTIASTAEYYDSFKAREIYQKINSLGSTHWKEAVEESLRRMEFLGEPVKIRFQALNGDLIDVTRMNGKVVLIDFWASWCSPSLINMPDIKQIHDKYHDRGFEIIGINFDNREDTLRQTLKSYQMTWTQYFDGQGWDNRIGRECDIKALPTYWLVDKKGIVVDVKPIRFLEEKIKRLLEE